MKNIFTFIFISFISSFCLAQSSSTRTLSDEEEKQCISDIRTKFKYIVEHLDSFTQKELRLDGLSTEGGIAYSYLEKNELRKIEEQFYGEMGKFITEYYIWDKKVFFIFEREYQYNSPIYFTEADSTMGIEAHDPDKSKIIENRYYFLDQKLIRWLNNDKNKVNKNSSEYQKIASKLKENFDFILEKFKE